MGVGLVQQARRNVLGERLEEVEALLRQRVRDRLDYPVVGQDPVDVVAAARRAAHLRHHIEGDPLDVSALGLEGADVDLHHVVAQRDPVERLLGRGGLGPRRRVREGKFGFVGHGVSGVSAGGAVPTASGGKLETQTRRSVLDMRACAGMRRCGQWGFACNDPQCPKFHPHKGLKALSPWNSAPPAILKNPESEPMGKA